MTTHENFKNPIIRNQIKKRLEDELTIKIPGHRKHAVEALLCTIKTYEKEYPDDYKTHTINGLTDKLIIMKIDLDKIKDDINIVEINLIKNEIDNLYDKIKKL